MTLYKFVTADRIDILKNGHIRFTQPAALNDPWELNPYIEKLMTNEFWESEIRAKAIEGFNDETLLKRVSEDIWKGFNRQQRRAQPLIKVEAIVKKLAEINPKKFKELYLKFFDVILDEAITRQKELIRAIPEALNKTIGILSLTEKPNNRLMWSHYANTYTGFVIAFDESHIFFTARRSDEDDVSGLHEIEYNAERPNMKSFIDYSEEHLSTFGVKLFFTKGKEWQYEHEWRMIKPLHEADKIIENPGGNIHLFALPSACITGVICGHNMDAGSRRNIIELLSSDERYRNVVRSETVLSDTSYDIEIRQF